MGSRYSHWQRPCGGAVDVGRALHEVRVDCQIRSKHARALAQAAVKALRHYGLPVKTITFDNGLEFASYEYIAQQLGAATYFAHPYHSCGPPMRERGLNENTNGLIRQYIPKSCPISIVRHTDVSWIQDQLNNQPRLCCMAPKRWEMLNRSSTKY